MSGRVRAMFAGVLCAALAACGGGGAGSTSMTSSPPLPTGANVAPLVVDAGPKQLGVNLPSVTVTICLPGTTTCQTIDHILVDTGSTGLRIAAEALAANMFALPAATTTTGDPMYECLTYASEAYSWGSVRLADVQIANGKASNTAIQLIGDPAIPTAPADCSGNLNTNPPTILTPQNSVADLGANGILGINVFLEDCGPACETIPNPDNHGFYYGCPATGCVGATVPRAAQVRNSISQFSGDNNGVELVLPAITAVGKPTAAGALVLGIDTQSNNQLGSAAVISVDPLSGNFTTIFNGQTYTRAGFVDSGSNGSFFADASLQTCTTNVGWYCPPTAVTLSATNQGAGASSATSTVSFSVASFDALSNANPGFAAYDNIAGPMPAGVAGFDWGLPFFFGRTVAVAFEGMATSAGAGPYVAYADF
jgi:Protein of unknown function (DUF3443)